MSEMSDYMEDSLIDHIFRTSSWSKPSVLAIALLTTAAIDGDTGQFSTGTGVEVTNANAYARVARNPLDANWDAPAGGNGVTANTAAITFPAATGSWGTVLAMAIVDNATYDTGNMLFHSVVDVNRTIADGDTAEFAAGAITITFA
jgi:hypothetical protein